MKKEISLQAKVSGIYQTLKFLFVIVRPLRKLYKQFKKISASRNYGWSDDECMNMAANVLANDHSVSFLSLERGSLQGLSLDFLLGDL